MIPQIDIRFVRMRFLHTRVLCISFSFANFVHDVHDKSEPDVGIRATYT